MMAFLNAIQDSGYATWLRETETIWGEDFNLCMHAFGMAMLVGLNVAIDLRILGAARRLPLAPMEKFFPLMYAGFWINAVSGLLLLVAYPVRAFVNPGFYVKIGGVWLGVLCLRRIKRVVFGNPANLDTRPIAMDGRVLAATSLLLWGVTITAGRNMAYSDVTGVQVGTSIAVFVAAVVMLLVGAVGTRLWGMLGWSADKPLRQDV